MKKSHVPAPKSQLMDKFRGHLSPRDRLAWDIMVATGLRVGDCVSLTRDQALNGAPIYAQKTGKPITVQLPPELAERVRHYMGDRGGYVFASPYRCRKGRPICRQTIARAIRKVALELHVDGLSAHSARKLYACNLYAECQDLARVQRALQHSNVATTALYLLSPKLRSEYDLKL